MEWHRSHEEIPQDCPVVVVANEFFDALPVHQFQRSKRGWSEILVDIADDAEMLHLRNVLAPGPTPASRLLLPQRLDGLTDGEIYQMPYSCIAPRAFRQKRKASALAMHFF